MDAGERTIDAALDVSRILDELLIRHAMIGCVRHGLGTEWNDFQRFLSG